MIGIAGASGAGKTTLARKLKNALGEKVTLLSQDSYYKDLSHLTREERARFNFDDPDSLDFELIEAHLKELKKGNSIDIPLYNFVTSTRESGTERIESKPTIILEGCLIFAVPEVRRLCDMKLFVDADMDICLCRRIERDQNERGRKFPDIKRQYLKTVRPMYLKHIAPSKQFADLVIPNANDDEIVLDFISHHLSLMVSPKSLDN